MCKLALFVECLVLVCFVGPASAQFVLTRTHEVAVGGTSGPLPGPFPDCGADPTADDLGCAGFPGCL